MAKIYYVDWCVREIFVLEYVFIIKDAFFDSDFDGAHLNIKLSDKSYREFFNFRGGKPYTASLLKSCVFYSRASAEKYIKTLEIIDIL